MTIKQEKNTLEELQKAEKHYSDSKFWDKLKKFGKKAGPAPLEEPGLTWVCSVT